MEEITKVVQDFISKRDWLSKHSEACLSKSIVIEAAELLEHFQWCDTGFDKTKVCDELADVLIYAIALCNFMEVDPEDIIKSKLEKVALKYPEITNL